MNWEKLYKKYPLSMSKLFQWLDIEEFKSEITGKTHEKYSLFMSESILGCFKQRDLYDFFDSYNIFIVTDICLGGKDKGKYFCDITDLHTAYLVESKPRKSREEAEEEIFESAFKLLEEKLEIKIS